MVTQNIMDAKVDDARDIALRIATRLPELGDAAYWETRIAFHAAPTLRRWKSATLLGPGPRPTEAMRACWRKHRTDWAGRFGASFVNLREAHKGFLPMVYHADLLADRLDRPAARAILRAAGYRANASRVDRLLGELADRCASDAPFPHEIGLFLDYPPHDVAGYMRSQGSDCRGECGWKVYGDPASAARRAGRFRRAQCEAGQRLLRELEPFRDAAREPAAAWMS